jgi:small-conductance mechanosensitive channel
MSMANPKPIDDFDTWIAGFLQPTALIELAVLAVCVAVAWQLAGLLRRAMGVQDEPYSVLFGRRIIDGAMFPLLLLLLGHLARAVLATLIPLAVFKVAIPIMVSLVVIRVGVKVFQAAFPAAPWVRVAERTISWGIWLLAVMWISGLLSLVLAEMDDITWKVGSSTLTLRTLVEGLVTGGVVMVLSLWVSSGIEARLLRDTTRGDLSLRKAVSNATRALLMFVGLMIALAAVGLDITALSVFSGAIGVGIGFGLQKLASNYVSGFVILAERRMRIGDNVRVDGFEGRITGINARYTLIRSPVGRLSIVPNEILVIQRVENLSQAQAKTWQSIVVTVAFGCDVDKVSNLLLEAALSQEGTLKEPAPLVALSDFGVDGLAFTLGYWIDSGDNAAQLRLRSRINQRALQLLREQGIAMPPPRVATAPPDNRPA